MRAALILALAFMIGSLDAQVVQPCKKLYIVAEFWGSIFEETITYINKVRISTNRDNCKKPVFLLREALYRLGISTEQIGLEALFKKQLQSYERVLFFDIVNTAGKKLKEYLKKANPEQCMLMIWEPPTMLPKSYKQSYHRYFGTIFVMNDDLVDNKKYIKFYCPQPSLLMDSTPVPFEEKKLCTMIFAHKKWLAPSNLINLYNKREELLNFFEQNAPEEFDLYGFGWDKKYRSYKGLVSTKKDVLRKYKFCIAYENTGGIKGYVTEKIFDAMVAGCVPVYWGASNISDYIPCSCFINGAAFATAEDLYHYLKNMNKRTYELYLAHIKEYLQNRRRVLLFSCENFVDTVLTRLVPNYDKRVVFNKQEQENLLIIAQVRKNRGLL